MKEFTFTTLNETTVHKRLLRETDDQVYRWNFELNPYEQSRTYVLLDRAQKPVGCASFRSIDIKLGELVLPGSLGHDLTTHNSDALLLAEFLNNAGSAEFKRGSMVSAAVPQSLRTAFMKAGWVYVGDAILMTKTDCLDRGSTCLGVPEFMNQITELNLEAARSSSFMFIKGSSILNWRTQHPHRRYANYMLDPRSPRGYMVLAYEHSGAEIVEFQALSEADLDEMLVTAEAFAERLGSLSVWSTARDRFREVLRVHGFKVMDKKVGLFVRMNEEGAQDTFLSDTGVFAKDWSISQMDLEMMSAA